MEKQQLPNIGPFRYELLVISQGNGKTLPNDFASCRIFICVQTPESKPSLIGYDVDIETDVTIGLGSTYVSCVIDLALQTMVEGSIVSIKFPDYPRLSELSLEVQLISFRLSEEVYELTPDAKLTRALRLKEVGTKVFRTKDTEVAFYKFSRALKYLLCIRNVGELPSASEIKTLRCQCYLNISACQLLTDSFISVGSNCSRALSIDPSSVKGFFRRARAQISLNEFEKARDDLVMAQSLEPNNTAVSKLLASVKAAMKKKDGELAKSMSKMFH